MKESICSGSAPNIQRSRAIALTALLALSTSLLAQSPPSESANPLDIPPEVLAMQIKHLDVEELTAEADRWESRLKDTVRRLNQVKADIWHENQALQVAEEAQSALPPGEDPKRSGNLIEQENALKEQSLDQLAALREERLRIIDRMTVVLDELSSKLGTTDAGGEKEEVLSYRRFVDAVKAVEVDTSDFKALRWTVVSWFVSPDGAPRLARNIGKFLAIIVGFWLLSLVLGRLVSRAMNMAHGASQILQRFVATSVRRITVIVGLLLGLTALGFNNTPLLAAIGAAGFAIAFALQNTLSNFASGLMIMLYKPFDIGDFVQTSEVMGTVKSMTLVTTNMMTPDNKLLVVPNNDLWGKVITNVTGSSERRVDLVFGIGYGDDIERAEAVLREVVTGHPMVLDEPEPVIAVSELADSSVNLICRPWVKTADYWVAYWGITREVKERFDAEGISIPFPQRDVHLYTDKNADA